MVLPVLDDAIRGDHMEEEGLIVSLLVIAGVFPVTLGVLKWMQAQKEVFLRAAFYFIASSIVFSALLLEYGDGNFLSYLTLWFAYGAIITMTRDMLLSVIYLALFGFLHETVWLVFGISPFVLLFHGSSILFSQYAVRIIFATMVVVVSSKFLYHKLNIVRIALATVPVAAFTLVWLSQGLPMTPLNIGMVWEVAYSYVWLASFLMIVVQWKPKEKA
jgi:hypothetical protein